MSDSHKKLIVFDTDGVIFKSQLLLLLSKHAGILNYMRSIWLCFLFNIYRLKIHELLEKVYIRLSGMTDEQFWTIYYKMKIVKHAEITIREIRNKGHHVALISSGVPDFIMKHLAGKLHANCGHGIDVKIEQGIFNGKIGGPLSFHDGKVQIVEQLLEENKLSWNDVIVIGDDRNNLDIMMLARASIGFNSNYPVRKKAKYLADGNDLRKVLDYLEIEDDPTFKELSSSMRREFAFSWQQEFRRKGVHICSALVPVLASMDYSLTIKLLSILTALFIFSEWLRLNGVTFPVLNLVTRLCTRTSERRRPSMAPITLSLGIISCLILFPGITSCVAILIVAFSDSIATMTGRFFGTHRWPYNRGKSLEGSIAFALSAFIICSFFIPLKIALLVSLVSCIIESLPFKYDNLSIPLGTGLFLWIIL